MKKSALFLFLPVLICLCSSANSGISADHTGKVTGTLCYPSDYLPVMKLYLKNTGTAEVFSQTTKEDQRTFEFKSVPSGTYIAYAYTVEETYVRTDKSTYKGSGGYTESVLCGLSVECTDHALIAFSVKADETTGNIQICDWYGAELPPEE